MTLLEHETLLAEYIKNRSEEYWRRSGGGSEKERIPPQAARVNSRNGRGDAIGTLVKAHGWAKSCTIETQVARIRHVQESFQNRAHISVREAGKAVNYLQSSSPLHTHTNVTHTDWLSKPPSMRLVSSHFLRRSKRRTARKVFCALCGVLKYTPPVKRKLARHRGPKARRVCVRGQDDQGSGNHKPKVKKLVIWLSRYPRVKLCDIGKVFEISRHFSCSLPPALVTPTQRSGVHCFRKQVIALMCQESLEDDGTNSSCQSQQDPLATDFSCSSGSSSPSAVGAELANNRLSDQANCKVGQDDISQKRKRTIADERFHATAINKDLFFLPSELNTCSRARVFVRRNRYLCSRAYITWPFSRNDPPPFVMSPRCSSTRGASASPRRPFGTSQEVMRNGETVDIVAKRDMGREQVVVPCLLEQSEVVSSVAQVNQVPHRPTVFHQSCHDLAVSRAARGCDESESTDTPCLKRVTKETLPAELETPSPALTHGQDVPSAASWSIGGRTTVDAQSSSSSEEDSFMWESQREQKSETDEEVNDASVDDSLDSTEVMCDLLGPLSSPSHDMCAVTSGKATNEVQLHEQDAIVLDVIDDDPDLFGSMVTEKRDEPTHTGQRGEEDAQATEPAVCTKGTILFNSKRCAPGPTIKAEVKENSLQWKEEALDFPPGNQLTKPEPCERGSSWARFGDLFVWQEENGNCNNGNDADWSSGRNTGRQLSSNLKQTTCNTDNFTLLKSGGPARASTFGSYCKFYFSENHFCFRTNCTFLHVPRSGDEKFCMHMVERFSMSNNGVFVKRAADLFTGYYEMCSPGLCFNVQVVTGLLASLLRLSFLAETLHVLNLLLRHNIRPRPECILSVFEHAYNRRIQSAIPQLVFLISKAVEAGVEFSVDEYESMQKCLVLLNAPKAQMDLFSTVKCRALAHICPSDMVNMTQVFIDLELCREQEDWRQLAGVFLRVCVSPCTTSHLLQFCVCVASALLVEPTHSHTPPYSTFAEAVFAQASDNGLDRSFLGRIGISMLIYYYRKRQWSKGQKIVEILSQQQPCYSVMKGVFSSEDTISRCSLITMATELHLHCGSMEGALNVLRDNNWFVSCSQWPCERADVVHRVAVQTRLAQSTSHRDALEVLTHLPGLQPPADSAVVQEYTGLFNSLLRSCLERHALLVAADALEFMLARGLRAELLLLQNLVQDLGKRNHWNRARILFQRALRGGYYPLVEVVPGSLVLELPCTLNEVEVAVCLEMFMSRNIPHSTQTPTITQAPVVILKRASDNGAVPESVYLSAGCRLLSSAQLLNPKLRLSYSTVNLKRDQVYTIEPGSAHNWLLCNHSWAHKLWSA